MYSLQPQFLACQVSPDAKIETLLEDAVMMAFTSTFAVRFTFGDMIIQINPKSVAGLFTEGQNVVMGRVLAKYRAAVTAQARQLTI